MTSTLDAPRPGAGAGSDPGVPNGAEPLAGRAPTLRTEAWLSYVDSGGRPRRIELTDAPPRLTVGRSSAGVDVSLPEDAQVSRLHAVLEQSGASGRSRTTDCRATAPSSTRCG